MSSAPPPARSKIEIFFSVAERVVLFALSASAGLINLLIALVVAAHFNIVQRKTVDSILAGVRRHTTVLERFFAPPDAPKRKPAAPAKTAKAAK